MKNIHYYICTLAVVLFVAFPAKAASEAEFGKLAKTYTLRADGSQELRVQKELTLFTHTAMNGLYGESFIIYNPEYQELKIHESYTRQKDGNIVKTPDNAFVEVLPSAAAGAPAYNGLKEMVVVHTGLELGATIYLDYSVITRPEYLPELDVCEEIGELSPIKAYVLSLSVPESKPLHYELLNGKAIPSVKIANGMKTVTWTLKNVQARSSVQKVSVKAGSMQAIVASTYASKADALNVIKEQMATGNAKEITELAQRLIAKAQTDEEKAGCLEEYVHLLGTCRLSLSETGYRIRPVTEIIRSAYGTDAEKIALLIALQQAAGIRADGAKAVFPKTENPDAAGLAAMESLFVTDSSIADVQDFVSVVDMNAQPVTLKPVSHAISKTDTLKITSDAGKTLANDYKGYVLPQSWSEWATAQSGRTMINTTCPVNLLLSYLPDEAYTCIVELPTGMKLVSAPVSKKIDNKIGTVEVIMKKDGDKMEILRTLKLKKQLITPAEYSDYYRLMEEWMDKANYMLVFQVEK